MDDSATAVVKLETQQGNVALVTINRPEARNAVNGDLANAMEAILDDFEADDNITVVIITGAWSLVPTSARTTQLAAPAARGLEARM